MNLSNAADKAKKYYCAFFVKYIVYAQSMQTNSAEKFVLYLNWQLV